MKCQIDNPSPGAVTGGNKVLALTREVNLDTISSDSSEEEIRDSSTWCVPVFIYLSWYKSLDRIL